MNPGNLGISREPLCYSLEPLGYSLEPWDFQGNLEISRGTSGYPGEPRDIQVNLGIPGSLETSRKTLGNLGKPGISRGTWDIYINLVLLRDVQETLEIKAPWIMISLTFIYVG